MSEPAVDPETVRHVADLARVDLSDEEVKRFADQFGEVIAAFDTLDDVPDVESEADLSNVLRADEVGASLDREAALQNAAETEDGFFKGPRVS